MAQFQKKERQKTGGRIPGSMNKSVLELRAMIQRVCGDPLEGMAAIATGDVIMLGYMTVKELREPATFDSRGRVVRVSGMERALGYVPVELRARMFSELSKYVYAQRKAIVVEGKPKAGAGLVLYMPHNNRDEPAAGVMVKKGKPSKP